MSRPDVDVGTQPLVTYRRGMLVLGALLVLATTGAFAYWWLHSRHYVATDNAYVGGDVIPVTAQRSGTIGELLVDDNEPVVFGAKIAALDPTDAHLRLERAKADLAKTVRQVRQLVTNDGQFQASMTLRQLELSRAEDRLQRRVGLNREGIISAEDMVTARSAVEEARATLRLDTEKLRSYQALAGGASIPQQPDILAAAVRIKEAYVDLAYTHIASPATGFVLRRSAQVGQRVSEGSVLMTIVRWEGLWVDANFKEDQVRSLRIGQPVQLVSDLYGDDVKYSGTVAELGIATGSSLSPIPSRNALGNWVKVVQRIPVRIALDLGELRQHPLRLGLSMRAVVDVRNTDGPMLSEGPKRTSMNTTSLASEQTLQKAQQLIDQFVGEQRPIAQTATRRQGPPKRTADLSQPVQ